MSGKKDDSKKPAKAPAPAPAPAAAPAPAPAGAGRSARARGGARLAVGQGPEDGPHLLLRRIDARDALDEAPRAPGRGRAPPFDDEKKERRKFFDEMERNIRANIAAGFELRRREHGAHERPRLAAARVAAVDVVDARRGPRAHAVDGRRLVSVRGRDDVPPIVVPE